jgi:ABC-2 type transport system ATP-binding protein
VKILGTKWRAETRKQLGYLPEERGLYRKLTVIDCITYLGSLLGMDRRPLLGKAEELLERTGMLPRKNDRIETLSRGMGQIIQFIVAILHDPEIVILDEPFANLDPLNTELLKNMLRELKGGGKAIILSTHAMADVEELCDRVLMIHNGRAILYGGLAEIRSRHGGKPKLVEVPSRSLNEIFIKVLEESHE